MMVSRRTYTGLARFRGVAAWCLVALFSFSVAVPAIASCLCCEDDARQGAEEARTAEQESLETDAPGGHCHSDADTTGNSPAHAARTLSDSSPDSCQCPEMRADFNDVAIGVETSTAPATSLKFLESIQPKITAQTVEFPVFKNRIHGNARALQRTHLHNCVQLT